MIYGGMSMLFEEFLTTNERKSKIVKLIDKIESTYNFIIGNNLHSMRNRAMTILLETNQINVKNQEEFDRIVSDSGWHASGGIAEVKDRYQHSFKLLKRLIIGELNTTAFLQKIIRIIRKTGANTGLNKMAFSAKLNIRFSNEV